jgi:cytochrome c556
MKVALCSAVLALAAVGLASAQEMKPEDVIKFRKGAYQVINWHMRPLGAMVKGEQPYNKELFVKNAAIIESLSRIVPDAFQQETDKGDTRAKPEIWSDPARFKQALERFQSEAARMSEVAKTGNFDQIRVQYGALSKSCGNCHDNFRSK